MAAIKIPELYRPGDSSYLVPSVSLGTLTSHTLVLTLGVEIKKTPHENFVNG